MNRATTSLPSLTKVDRSLFFVKEVELVMLNLKQTKYTVSDLFVHIYLVYVFMYPRLPTRVMQCLVSFGFEFQYTNVENK